MPEYRKTIAFLQQRERARQKVLDTRFRDAWRDYKRILSYIISEHNPRRIWQWGSLLERKHFSEVSDIDIAVEGLDSADQIFNIVAKAEELTDFPVDIIELEKIAPEYSEVIKQKGKCVYGCS